MKGVTLVFFVRENLRLHGRLAYEWLLDKANALGLPGGSAFRALAGFGHHHALHAERFFELAGELPVRVEFAGNAEEIEGLLELLRQEQVDLFYTRFDVEFGRTGPG
jgi:uncharacterized protein